MLPRFALPLSLTSLLAVPAAAQDASAGIERNTAILVQQILIDRHVVDGALEGTGITGESPVYMLAQQYSGVSKGYWLNVQCKFVEGEDRQKFEKQIALFTNIVGSLLVQQGGLEVEEAGKRIKALQLFSREEMSRNNFLGCGPEAKAVVETTIVAANRVALRASEGQSD